MDDGELRFLFTLSNLIYYFFVFVFLILLSNGTNPEQTETLTVNRPGERPVPSFAGLGLRKRADGGLRDRQRERDRRGEFRQTD